MSVPLLDRLGARTDGTPADLAARLADLRQADTG
jgi:hypothetical protein